MTSRMLFIIGAVGLAASVYWWADYYTTFLDVTGRKDSTAHGGGSGKFRAMAAGRL